MDDYRCVSICPPSLPSPPASADSPAEIGAIAALLAAADGEEDEDDDGASYGDDDDDVFM
jgi:hypothetical protein